MGRQWLRDTAVTVLAFQDVMSDLIDNKQTLPQPFNFRYQRRDHIKRHLCKLSFSFSVTATSVRFRKGSLPLVKTLFKRFGFHLVPPALY